jgi:transcriptional regulator with XRE-family HTH domain
METSNYTIGTIEVPMIGEVLRDRRKAMRLTLDSVAELSKVSKSMLSQIERGQVNPSFAVIWSLTRALNMRLADLAPYAQEGGRLFEVLSPAGTPQIQNDDGTCRLRIISPPATAGDVEWYHLEIDGGGRLVSSAHEEGAWEHLTVIDGVLEIRSGASSQTIGSGGTARYAADVAHAILNPDDKPAQAFLVTLYKR